MAKNDKLTPIKILRAEKRELKKMYKKDEERLLKNWNYLTNNVGSLLFYSALNGTRNAITGKSSKKKEEEESSSVSALTAYSVFASSLPILWDIAQPMLIGIGVKKIKSFFTRRFKKKD